jgi:hypothetical protein
MKHLFDTDSLNRFWDRLTASKIQQFRPAETRILRNPINGNITLLAPGRELRHREKKEATQ